MSRVKNGLPFLNHKQPALSRQIAVTHFRAALAVPLSMLESAEATIPAETVVKKGEVLFTDSTAFPTLSPVSGVLTGYTEISHPLCGTLTCACIRPEDGDAVGFPPSGIAASADEIIAAAKSAAVLDEIDGVPLYEKLQLCRDGGCVVVADGVEAQPFASAAFCVLRECAEKVREGLRLACNAVAAAGGHVAVCTDDAAAAAQLEKLYTKDMLYFTEKRYPVDVYTASDAPVLRIGVQALVALYDAVVAGTPAVSAVVTVAGDCVKEPQNLRVAFGTPIQSLLDFCGVTGTPAVMVMGDAVTGVSVTDTALPVLPGMTCLLALSAVPAVENDPCFGCGRCAQVCHRHLLPYEICRRFENMHYERLTHLTPERCDACGACSYVCPARRDVMSAVQQAARHDGTIFLDWGGDTDD